MFFASCISVTPAICCPQEALSNRINGELAPNYFCKCLIWAKNSWFYSEKPQTLSSWKKKKKISRSISNVKPYNSPAPWASVATGKRTLIYNWPHYSCLTFCTGMLWWQLLFPFRDVSKLQLFFHLSSANSIFVSSSRNVEANERNIIAKGNSSF